MHRLRIFAACPSDMVAERARVATVAASLKPLADSQNIVIDVTDWSAVAPGMGRPEQVILDQRQPTDWDVFVGILWHRFGTAPNAADPVSGSRYLGGTEEEFKSAYRLWKETGRPRIMMYRCIRAIPPKVLDAEQYTRVEQFFAEFNATEGAHPGLYHEFEQTDGLERLLLENLQHVLIEFAKRFQDTPISPGLIQALAPKVPDNLPRRAPFYGRERELEIALRALSPKDRTWGVLVDGIGGIGKSALAIEAAWKCKDAGLFDAFIFVSAKQDALRPEGIKAVTAAAKTLDEFLNETARVLGQAGIGQLAGRAKRDALLDALRATRALLIYDNLETLSKEEQEAMAELLRDLPQGSKAIITSRRRGGEGGVWLRLDQLEWDAAREIIRNELTRDAALARKLDAVGEGRWQELYDETKGSPLALVHTLGLIRTRASLTFDGALALLRGNSLPDLHEFIFREAQRELTENDRQALNALSFFAPSATFEALMAVSELSRNVLEISIDRLSALSLVNVVPGAERFALHPFVRSSLRDALRRNVEANKIVGTRFARYWVVQAERLHAIAGEAKDAEVIEREAPNFDATEEWLYEIARGTTSVGDRNDTTQLLSTLARYLWRAMVFSGRWDRCLEYCRHAYEFAAEADAWFRIASHAHDIAWIHLERGEFAEVETWLARGADAATRSGESRARFNSLNLRGLLLHVQERFDEAFTVLEEALTLAREMRAPGLISQALDAAARAEIHGGRQAPAEAHLLEAIDVASGPVMLVAPLGRLAWLYASQGRWTEARKIAAQAEPLARQLGRLDWIAGNEYVLALIHEAAGDFQQSLASACRARAIFEKLRIKYKALETLLERLQARQSGESTTGNN
jgi:tetratricopeptide (TPR) repeat protein